jgi:hypothetical protein
MELVALVVLALYGLGVAKAAQPDAAHPKPSKPRIDLVTDDVLDPGPVYISSEQMGNILSSALEGDSDGH